LLLKKNASPLKRRGVSESGADNEDLKDSESPEKKKVSTPR